MSVFRFPPVVVLPNTTRSRNDGAESDMPILARAMLPDLRKYLRFISTSLLISLSAMPRQLRPQAARLHASTEGASHCFRASRSLQASRLRSRRSEEHT